MNHRRRQIQRRKRQIKDDKEAELDFPDAEVQALRAEGKAAADVEEYLADRVQHIEKEAARQEKEALRSFGNNFWKADASIAPIRGALATWGLTIDDLGVASFHGTSTKANDKNESSVICKQLAHLGRTKGNAVLGIFQKFLTGHPKGAAGAWMLNGALQVLNTGLVPGNRNADNVDKVMEDFDYIVYPSRSLQTDGIKAFSVTSFGFGQKGAQVIGVHPRYLYATLEERTFNAYRAKVEARQKKAYRYFHNGMINNTIFRAKNDAPYTDDQLRSVLLNPDARVIEDKKTGEYSFPSNFMKLSEQVNVHNGTKESLAEAIERQARSVQALNTQIGWDVEDSATINVENQTFIHRNFTKREQEFCPKAASGRSPQLSYAGRWSAKEAVFKSLRIQGKGAGAAMTDIEIISSSTGAPVVEVRFFPFCRFVHLRPRLTHFSAPRTCQSCRSASRREEYLGFHHPLGQLCLSDCDCTDLEQARLRLRVFFTVFVVNWELRYYSIIVVHVMF